MKRELPAERGVLFAWAAVLLLLFSEASAFVLLFDRSALWQVEASWAKLVLGTRFLVPCAIAITSGLVLFGGEEFLRALWTTRRPRALRWVVCLCVHGFALLFFVRASLLLFQDPPASLSTAYLGLAAWLLSGALLVSSLLAILLPRSFLRYLSRRGAWKLAAGVAIGFMAWMAGQAGQDNFWSLLSVPTLASVRGVLGLFLSDALIPADGIHAGTRDFSVRIGSACSGVEGIGLAWIFLSFYLWVARDRLRFPRALWLVAIGTSAVWCANVLRIVGIILIGDLWSARIAVDAFHTRMGWVLFCGISLGLVAIAERSKVFARVVHAPQADPTGKLQADKRTALAFVFPLFAVLATQLIGGSVVTHASDVYPASMLVGLGAFWHFRHTYGSMRFEWSWPAVGVGVLVFVIWVGLDRGPSVSDTESALSIFASAEARGPLISGTHIFSTMLIVPLSEELAFRGYILRRLISTRVSQVRIGAFTLYSCLCSSLLFGLTHERWFVASLAGLAYALVMYRKQNLAHSVLAHAVTNGLLVVWAFCT